MPVFSLAKPDDRSQLNVRCKARIIVDLPLPTLPLNIKPKNGLDISCGPAFAVAGLVPASNRLLPFVRQSAISMIVFTVSSLSTYCLPRELTS